MGAPPLSPHVPLCRLPTKRHSQVPPLPWPHRRLLQRLHLINNMEMRSLTDPAVRPAAGRFPYSIVWGHLPPLTWCLPCIGHMAIADSMGAIHDFAGPYTIGVDNFMTGTVYRYCQLDPEAMPLVRGKDAATAWDSAIARADDQFRERSHNLLCNNCHHHTALALANMGLPLSQFGVWKWVMLHGAWVSRAHMVKTMAGFFIIVLIIVIVNTV